MYIWAHNMVTLLAMTNGDHDILEECSHNTELSMNAVKARGR